MSGGQDVAPAAEGGGEGDPVTALTAAFWPFVRRAAAGWHSTGDGGGDELYGSSEREAMSSAFDALDAAGVPPTLLLHALPEDLQASLCRSHDCRALLPPGVTLCVWRDRAFGLAFSSPDRMFDALLEMLQCTLPATPVNDELVSDLRTCIDAMRHLLALDDMSADLADSMQHLTTL